MVGAGARVLGGPFQVTLHDPGGFAPQEGEEAPAPSALDRYTQGTGLGALVFATLTGFLTRSPARAFSALLLLSPRPALIGADAADQSASARILRAGVTHVGSRGRPVRRPDTLVIESARVLTDGLEVNCVEVLDSQLVPDEATRLAAGIAAAAESPWGAAFPAGARIEASDGTFDGTSASADVDGARWRLGAPAGGGLDGAEQVLELSGPGGRSPAARILLRPRVRREAAQLVATCRRLDVEVEVLSRGASPAARSVAERAGARLIEGGGAADRGRELKREGRIVAVLADSVLAGEALEECDLAIALASGRRGHFLARADLLAPALDAVAATVEAGAERDRAVRDSIGLSLAANAAGAVWGLRAAPTFETAAIPANIAALAAIGAGWYFLRRRV
jgi:cation transport ATPase